MISTVVILASSFLTCLGSRNDLEAEHADVNTTGGGEIYQDAASGGIAVKLFQNDYIVWHFNITCASAMLVLDVIYSNHGFSDEIELQLSETIMIGSFRTEAVPRGGESWNVFRNSGIVGNPVSLLADQHALKLVVRSADEDGVEIDKVIQQLKSFCIPPDDTITRRDIIGWTIGSASVLVAAIGIIIATYQCCKRRNGVEHTSSRQDIIAAYRRCKRRSGVEHTSSRQEKAKLTRSL